MVIGYSDLQIRSGFSGMVSIEKTKIKVIRRCLWIWNSRFRENNHVIISVTLKCIIKLAKIEIQYTRKIILFEK